VLLLIYCVLNLIICVLSDCECICMLSDMLCAEPEYMPEWSVCRDLIAHMQNQIDKQRANFLCPT
jgi:hypothetical protein